MPPIAPLMAAPVGSYTILIIHHAPHFHSLHPSPLPLPLAPPPSVPCREVSSSERPLLIQRRWEANGQKVFELKVKPSIPLQVRNNGLLHGLKVSLHSLWFVHAAHVMCLVVQRNSFG